MRGAMYHQAFERRAEEQSTEHGCPATTRERPKVDTTVSKSRGTKGEAGPDGCTCTSLYEHRLLEPFPHRKRARQ
jgi:hypothetical protein